MTPMLIGTALALIALAFVLYPLFREPLGVSVVSRAPNPERMSTAMDALREIEFDHATGKLSESDYAELKRSYTERAVVAMRARGPDSPASLDSTDGVVCGTCGPRPEADAAFCSDCGRALAA